MDETNPLADFAAGLAGREPLPFDVVLDHARRRRRQRAGGVTAGVATSVALVVALVVSQAGSTSAGPKIPPLGTVATPTASASVNPVKPIEVVCGPQYCPRSTATAPPPSTTGPDTARILTGVRLVFSGYKVVDDTRQGTASIVTDDSGDLPVGTVSGPGGQVDFGPETGERGSTWLLSISALRYNAPEKDVAADTKGLAGADMATHTSGTLPDGSTYAVGYTAKSGSGPIPGPGKQPTGPYSSVGYGYLIGPDGRYVVMLEGIGHTHATDPDLGVAALVKILESVGAQYKSLPLTSAALAPPTPKVSTVPNVGPPPSGATLGPAIGHQYCYYRPGGGGQQNDYCFATNKALNTYSQAHR